MKLIAGLISSLWILSGCAFLNVSLIPQERPLTELVLEGRGKPKIVIIDLDGMITFKEEKDGFRISGNKPSKVSLVREALLKAESDPEVLGVILRINSPGGTAGASDTIHHEILSFREKKKIPVIAYIMEVGTSGGYYVAAAADRIVASPAAVTGSIGVIAMRFNVEGLMSKIGASAETYKSGPMKDFWSPFRPATPEEKTMLQSVIDRLYARFVQVVYASRRKVLSEGEVKNLADGRILTAGQALDAKLIDQVSYLDETVEALKKSLNISQARVITYVRPRTFKSNIYSESPALPFSGPPTVNLISINAEDLSSFSGVHFMYLWAP